MGKLFLLFAILPIVEIALLINVGEQIGGWNTVAIVILTAVIGAHLVRQQGLSTQMQAQQKMQYGELPGQEMMEGLLLVIAGVLLVTPGFVTDALGFLCCLPFTRPIIAKSLLKHVSVTLLTQPGGGFSQSRYSQSDSPNEASGDIIEGEFTRKDDNVKDKLSKPE